jgi:hypothetical protein
MSLESKSETYPPPKKSGGLKSTTEVFIGHHLVEPDAIKTVPAASGFDKFPAP